MQITRHAKVIVIYSCLAVFIDFQCLLLISRTFLAGPQPPLQPSQPGCHPRQPLEVFPYTTLLGRGGGFIPSQPASQSRHPSPKPANQPASQSGCAFPQSASQLDPPTAANQWVLLMISCDFQISCNGHTSGLHRISVGFARGTLYDFV